MAIKLLLLLLLVCEGTAHASTYYAAPSASGSWSAATSQSTPCSAATAVANAVAGDTVYFASGTYMLGNQGSDYHTPILQPAHSGGSGSPITFRSSTVGGAVLSGTPATGSATAAVIGAYQRSYIVWDGFKVTTGNTATAAVAQIDTSDHVTVENCELVGGSFGNGGNNVGGVVIAHSSYTVIDNNYIHGYHDTGENHNTAAIWTQDTSYSQVSHNTLGGNSSNIYSKYQSQSDSYFNNLSLPLTNTTNASFYIQNFSGAVTGLNVHHNIIVGGGYGISLDTGQTSGNSASIYNNTFYGQLSAAVGVGTNLSTSWAAWNNIVSGTPSNTVVWTYAAGDPSYLDYNGYYGSGVFMARYYGASCSAASLSAWQSGCGYDTHSASADPSLVNPGGSSAADYKRTAYPANGRGGAYETVMGAYITGAEVIGYTAQSLQNTTRSLNGRLSGRIR